MTRCRAGPVFAATLCVLFIPFDGTASDAPDAAFTETLEQARQAYQQHQFSEAVKYFRRASDLHKNACDECLWGLANSYESLHAFKNVSETCDQLIPLVGQANSAHLAAVYNLKGFAIFSQSRAAKDTKHLPDAVSAFRSALAADPALNSPHFNLGFALLVLGDEAGGVAELKTYLEKEPNGGSAENARRLLENPHRAGDTFAPKFAFTTMDGSYVSLDDLRGKVVMLDFWGSWCRPCVNAVGSLKRIQRRYEKEPFVLISVSVHDPEDRWREFVAKHEMTWPQYLDLSSEVARAYGVFAFPSYIVIDHEGFLVFRTTGDDSGHAANAIDDALKKLKRAASTTERPPG